MLAAFLGLGGVSTASSAESPPNVAEGTETDTPVPPAFDTRRLIALDMPSASSLKLGLDPATLSISADGIVRYVVVATSASGATNVMYEGIRCATAEYRVYARHHPTTGWRSNPNTGWQSLYDAMPSKHPLNLARGGICAGKTPNHSPADMIQALKGPASARF